MDKKSALLETIASALTDGTITQNDLQSIIDRHTNHNQSEENIRSQLSAVDIMFYISGIVLFAAIAALVGQVWDGGPAARIFLSAGTGALLWAVALYFILKPHMTDIQKGMTNALLLTGSLSIIYGGFIIANDFFDLDDMQFYAISLTLAVLGVLHIAFGWQIRRSMLLLIGTLLAVAAFPSFVFGLMQDTDAPMYAYCLIVATSAGLLTYATRIVSRLSASGDIGKVFDPLAAFAALMSLYVASYDDTTGLVWLLALVLGIIGLFYLSIVTQNKLLLGNGSFFLVLAIITISFRYFSDNIAISLLISAAGLLGTAIMAANINRRYLK